MIVATLVPQLALRASLAPVEGPPVLRRRCGVSAQVHLVPGA